MEQLEVLAVAPPGRFDPNLAIAASRASALGFVNDVPGIDAEIILDEIVRVSRLARGPFGVRTESSDCSKFLHWRQRVGTGFHAVILAGPRSASDLQEIVPSLKRSGLEVLLEAVNGAEMEHACRYGIDGVILKGNESGGRVGTESAFVLLQRWRRMNQLRPSALKHVIVQGGIGLHSAAACLAGGATGVLLDTQLLLARESAVEPEVHARLSACDGSETVCLGEAFGSALRLWCDNSSKAFRDLMNLADRLAGPVEDSAGRDAEWKAGLQTVLDCARFERKTLEASAWLFGQEIAFAKKLADQYVTVGGIIGAIRQSAAQSIRLARKQKAFAPGSEFAKRHSTQYPIFQGPMTRVSDTAAFAASVASAGGLPFLALALLRKNEVEPLLTETRKRIGSRSWGVGILGFVPQEIRKEQIDCVLAARPPYAIIAGGRPDQAKELEKAGIATYLHVPAPGLLNMFLKDGATRFIFEGRECGGHVGPRTSFILWESMVGAILDHLGPNRRGEHLQVVFAGGIHDGVSAAMASAIAAPLVERGVAVGLLMGTAYLFTHEAVAAGAIVPRFQDEAIRCESTVLLQTGPGHAIRCIRSPYFDVFESERRRLKTEGKSYDEIVRHLEWMNLGRLRLASKGVERAREGAPGNLAVVDEDRQFGEGMYMIGQVAGLRDKVVSASELHEEVASGSVDELMKLSVPATPEVIAENPCDIAIIGMSCFYPQAPDVVTYWTNVLAGKNAVTEVPSSHWDWRLFYDPDPRKPDKIISKWGGFLDDIRFDPLRYGITPASMPAIEPLQLYLLEAVRHALDDAGYGNRPFDRSKTCAILGIGGGGSPLGVSYGFRTCIPLLETVPDLDIDVAEVERATYKILPTWTEDSFPGILMNVAVGRVANRFDFGGANYAIDAACASSLAAVQACIRELESGSSDLAVAMGADSVQTPYAYMCFSKTHALSPTGRCRPFDAAADGIVLSEGIGVVVLKRLADAERDGDRIYAVIKGMGASSDGKAKGLTAPRREGQALALQRAYNKAGISPASVELVEAHGTGTVVGDQTEAQTISEFFAAAGAKSQACAIGSVKSMIGHSKCAAGIAGLIKTAMAVRTKTLPPTLVESRNEKADFLHGPLFLNTKARPWIHADESPRRAGVSAFGFGGTNFHAVLEEYRDEIESSSDSAYTRWPTELVLLRRRDRQSLRSALAKLADQLRQPVELSLAAIARAAWQSSKSIEQGALAAIVASDLADLAEKLAVVIAAADGAAGRLDDPRGIYFADLGADEPPKIAFLFPGQGSQYPDMLAELAMAFDEVRSAFENADRAIAGAFDRPLSKFVFPPSAFGEEEERTQRNELTRTEVAQPAIGAASMGVAALLASFGIQPDMAAGHSYGEYAALAAANALTLESLITISKRRGETLIRHASAEPGAMAALETDGTIAAALIEGIDGVVVANLNSPRQTVISGYAKSVEAAIERCAAAQIRAQKIAVACGFHSPHVAGCAEAWEQAISEVDWSAPTIPVYSNLTADVHSTDPAMIRQSLVDHLSRPVRFVEQLEKMVADGAKVFLEVGPGSVLTGLARQLFADRSVVALSTDVRGRHGLTHLCHLLAQLATNGVNVDLDRMFEGRRIEACDLDAIASAPVSRNLWIINSVRSRPWDAPEPLLIGQRRQPRSAAKRHAGDPPSKGSAFVQENTGERKSAATRGDIPAAASGAVRADAAKVMLQFQELMAKFLDTQRSVMQQYLGGRDVQGMHPGLNGGSFVPPESLEKIRSPEQKNGRHSSTGSDFAAIGSKTPAKVADATAPPTSDAKTESTKRVDRDWLESQLLDLIAKRTGYPREMIGADLDLEADLGIDSIKRVEILGSLAEMLGEHQSAPSEEMAMEKLTSIKTLRGILDHLEPIFSRNGSNGVGRHAVAGENSRRADAGLNGTANREKPKTAHEVQRALVRLKDSPLPHGEPPMLPSGTVILVDDGQQVAASIARRLADFGQDCVIIRHVDDPSQEAEAAADLCDEAAVKRIIGKVRSEYGGIGGLIHLLPLNNCNAEPSYARSRRDSLSLYLLTRCLQEDLLAASEKGSAILWAVTGLGGGLGFETIHEGTVFAGEGGPIGFLKCVAFECPSVVVRAIDVDPTTPPESLADTLLSELTDRDGPLEVGWLGSRRVTWEPVAAPLNRTGPAKLELKSDSVVLVTGGARGITATAALEIAKRSPCNLVVVGRSAEPEEEAEDTRNLEDAASIKGALLKRFERERKIVAPAAVESAYRRLIADREIAANLSHLRKTGAKVHYYSLDVRDDAAFAELLDALRHRFGGVDAVIHGAGVIEDKLVRDKTPESFERVFETKVRSALTLAAKLDPARLKAFLLFSSIASRYGNKGQSDYAAANETLSKLALDLDRRWPGRVAAIAWGPWSDIGMVAEIQKHLVQRGLRLISPSEGPRFVLDELEYGSKGEAEVIVAGGADHLARPSRPVASMTH